jgi:hypothetical protein
MSITYQIDHDAGMLFIVAAGATTQPERLEAMRTWLSDPAFRPGLQTLCDWTMATTVPTLPELEEIVGVIRQHATTIGRKKLAIVTARPVAFGVARQFGALAPGTILTVQVFKDRVAALAWLAQSPD